MLRGSDCLFDYAGNSPFCQIFLTGGSVVIGAAGGRIRPAFGTRGGLWPPWGFPLRGCYSAAAGRWNLGLRTAWQEYVRRTSAYRALSSKFGSAILFLNLSLFLLDTGMRFLGFLAIVLWLLKFIQFLSRSRLNFRPLPFCCPS